MTPEKCAELTNQLADHGLSVLLTRDYDSILIQLARLAQFERLMMNALEDDPMGIFQHVVAEVHAEQNLSSRAAEAAPLRPLEIEDIPVILTAAHKHLHDQLGKPSTLDPATVRAAVSAFVGILCRR